MSSLQVLFGSPYLIFACCINLYKQYFVESGDRESSYESFLEKLKIVNGAEKECRYGLFDFEYTHQCQGTQEVLTIWIGLLRYWGMF